MSEVEKLVGTESPLEVGQKINEIIENGGGGGLEIGDIGFTQMAIDETLGKRRKLNGQLIIQDQYVEFTNIVKASVELNPDLACTEEEWQTAVTMSANGVCYKFVIDDEAGTIRLPKYPDYFDIGIDGAKSVDVYGNGKAFGLQRIGTNNQSANPYMHLVGQVGSGDGLNLFASMSSGANFGNANQSVAVQSNPSYSGLTGSVDTESEQIKGTYFIQVATGAETEDNIINEIELNNPFSLLDYKYSEYELNNLSWLRSQGQYNSKAIYPAVYDLLLKIYNGTETKTGISVKLSTEEYTDYDFVLNTAEETFRLPIKVKVLPLGTSAPLFTQFNPNDSVSATSLMKARQNNGTASTLSGSSQAIKINQYGTVYVDGANAVNFDVSAYTYADLSNATIAEDLYLYFYVGETVQNAYLINAGRIEEKITNALAKPHIIDTYVNGASWYRVWSDGWCEQGGSLIGTANTNTSVTLLKEYANTNYQVQLTYNETLTGATNGTQSAANLKTTTSFAIGSQGGKYNWYTYGYMA